MRGEFDAFGVYLPPLLPVGLFAWVLTIVIIRALNRIGFYRVVWHRPLVNVAVYVLVLGATIFGLTALLPA